MEDDARSDSGVSTLRSDGARSSGDERSGSRSSAISDDRWVRGQRWAKSRPFTRVANPDPYSIGSVDPYSESGSRRAKMTHKSRNFFEKFMF